MGGYAGFTYAYHRVLTAKAFKRRAAAPGQALIAGLIGVVKIGAARALEQMRWLPDYVTDQMRQRAGRGRVPRNHDARAREPPGRCSVPVRRCAAHPRRSLQSYRARGRSHR